MRKNTKYSNLNKSLLTKINKLDLGGNSIQNILRAKKELDTLFQTKIPKDITITILVYRNVSILPKCQSVLVLKCLHTLQAVITTVV